MVSLFALGSNGSGQLGIGHREDVSVPKPVLFAGEPLETNVATVAAGGNHTLLLTDSGDLYWSGDPTSGACGIVSHDAAVAEPRFRRMMIDQNDDPHNADADPVRLVAATWQATVFVRLDQQGRRNTRVFSCGIGEKGELGHGLYLVRIPRATQLVGFPPPDVEVVDLAAGMNHVVAVLSNGEAYGWGNGRKGQLGAPEGVISSPRKIEGVPFEVKRAVCGKEFTCLLGDAVQGKLLVVGSDKWDIRGKAPSALPGWQDIRASWGNVFVLSSSGQLTSWGRNDFGQNRHRGDAKVLRIATGSEHAVALLDSHDVLAWGWGEHGNCGPPSIQGDGNGRQNIIASSKYIPPGSRISGVGAGCATSWIIIEETS